MKLFVRVSSRWLTLLGREVRREGWWVTSVTSVLKLVMSSYCQLWNR